MAKENEMKNRKVLISLIMVLILLQLGLFFVLRTGGNQSVADEKKITNKVSSLKMAEFNQKKSEVAEALPEHSSYFSKQNFYDEAYTAINSDYKIEKKIYGGIIPHHLIVKNKIASFFKALEGSKYKRVVLIGPNHFDAGDSKIILSRAKWQTPYGELMPDLALIDSLVEFPQVAIEEEPFYREHSISGLVAFIKKSLPDAEIVPIILRNKAKEADLTKVAERIFAEVNSDETLVLASVDFSHYLPADVADFHDKRSVGIIESFDLVRVKSMEIDSPASIFILLKYLGLAKSRSVKYLYHTNSGVMMGQADEPTTTHNFFYFNKGDGERENTVSMMFFGDIMLDRYIGKIVEQHGLAYLFENLQGEENRFFRGVDIIGANLEGAVTNKGEHYEPTMINDFAFKPKTVVKLKKYNFNYFNLANNHFSDQGTLGMLETRENLDSLGFYYSGCKDRKVDKNCSVKIVNIADKKVALVGLSMVYGSFNLEKAQKIIQTVQLSSDFVVVNIHWGQEYKHNFNITQQKVGRALIDAGADILIGHHPHIVQGMEIYKGRPIFYSLGNFIFDQPKPSFPRDNSEGLALGITLQEGSFDVDLFPVEFIDWQLSLMRGDVKKRFFSEFLGWSVLSEKHQGSDFVFSF